MTGENMPTADCTVEWFTTLGLENMRPRLLDEARLVDAIGKEVDAIARLAAVINEMGKPVPPTFSTTLTET